MDHRRRARPVPPATPSSAFPAIAVPYQGEPSGPLISLATRAGELVVRDAAPSDMEAYVSYWHHSGERVKDLLGIDRRKLGSIDDSRERFFNMIRSGGFQKDIIFTITLGGRVVGYTNINQHGPDHNYAHLHTYRSSIHEALKHTRTTRGPKTGYGIAAVLIGPIIAMYFHLYPIRRVVLQTRPDNSPINRALDLYLLQPQRTYVKNPAGLAGPGEQLLRYVRREDLPQLVHRAQLLTRSMELPARGEHGQAEPGASSAPADGHARPSEPSVR